MDTKDQYFMTQALGQARRAASLDEVPIGALVVENGIVIGAGYNLCICKQDPTAHAEILAIRDACSRKSNYRLQGATLYVTLEPCAMCMGAIFNARIKRVVFGAADLKAGACGSVLNLAQYPSLNHHTTFDAGVMATECAKELQSFFKEKRPDSEKRLSKITTLDNLPNLDKKIISALQKQGYNEPQSLKDIKPIELFQQIKHIYGLDYKHLAMLLSLRCFIDGQPAQSWKLFEPQAYFVVNAF